jgi:hypothetical protein
MVTVSLKASSFADGLLTVDVLFPRGCIDRVLGIPETAAFMFEQPRCKRETHQAA